MAVNLRELPEKLWMAAGERMRALAGAPIVRKSIDRANTIVGRGFEQLALRIAPAWQAAHGWYSKREQREKVLLRALGAVLGVIVLYNFIYLPFVGLGEGLSDRVVTRRQQLSDVRTMMRSYQQFKVELAATEKRTVRSQDFSLFSIIEQSLTKSVGRDKISSITPSDRAVPGGYQQFTVDLKLAGLNLAQIIDVLYGVQTLPMPVTVSNLHVRQRTQDPHSYDVDMTCMSLGRNG
jgi:Type II secretion system (T2SS), protein M